ncbi:MAG: radical SAM protein [Alphaproteobacteria bacterium]|nr:radical SAM protein [Alphaproteobacteria bacterium]
MPDTALPIDNGTKPTRLRVEASSFCQLRCPSCPTTDRAIDAHVGKGFLKPADFAALLDANPAVREIELSNYGEALMNPGIPDILRIAHERGVMTMIANGANLNTASPAALEALVRYRVQSIMCSIDGATQETYEKYRVRGNLEKVLANIRAINDWKTRLGIDEPLLVWRMILFEHNKHEVEIAHAMATQLGMRFKLKLSWDEDIAPTEVGPEVLRWLDTPAVRRSDWEAQTGETYLASMCEQLWDEPQINWDGKVLGCCRNFWGDFGGNVFKQSMDDALSHEKMRHAKAMLRGEAGERADVPCSTCDIYHKRRAAAQWINRP